MDARNDTGTSRYHEVYARAQRDPKGFWADAAREIDWFEPAKKVFDPDAGIYGRWFTGASCNTCWNAVDRHVATRGDQAALIYDSPVANSKRSTCPIAPPAALFVPMCILSPARKGLSHAST